MSPSLLPAPAFIPRLLAVTILSAATLFGQSPIHIQVHAGGPASQPIPQTVFGTFLEPIGNSTYQGLWAEILRNPSFESGLWSIASIRAMVAADPELTRASQLALPEPWEPLDAGQGNRYEPRRGDAANSYESLAIFGLPDRETGVLQQVYLPVHRTLKFRGSLFVKHLSGSDLIRISLRTRNSPAEVVASTELHAANQDWQKYSFALELSAGAVKPLDPLNFVIAVQGDERAVIDQASLLPADAADGLDPDMVRLAREMHTPLVRFGGNFTSGYHWRDGIGPLDKRVSMRNVSWGIPETNQFGTDEFLHFCELINAQPQIALNLGTGTPDEAADWVKYVDEHWTRHAGLLWELGNELWGNWNDAYPTLDELAGRTLRFSEAVRKVDPTARLIATGQDPDVYEKWNATQLQNPPETFNLLSTHFVVTTDRLAGQDQSPAAIARDTLALPVALERKLQDMQKQIQATGRPNVHVAFTEWLFHSADNPDAPRFDNFAGGLTAGSFLNMLMRNSGIVPVSDMTGIIEFAGIWKKRGRVFATPSYYAFQMFSETEPKFALPVDSDSPAYDVQGGITRLPEIPHVPYLDISAVRNAKGGISMFVINRDLNSDRDAEVSLEGVQTKGEAQVTELSAPGLYDGNDEIRPTHVVPKKSTATVAGSRLRFVFRAASLTRIDFAVQ